MSNGLLCCRSCGRSELEPVLDLGRTPLANALLTEGELSETERIYPLKVVFCTRCSLVQLTETVPPETLFREYVYFSSFADTVVDNARVIADRMIKERGLGEHSLAVEIASNDGYLLQNYVCAGIPVLGIEPAANIATTAMERGIRTIPEFFGSEIALQIRECGEQADVLHANNVLAHVADLNGVVEGIATILHQDGVAVIEIPYLRDLIEKCEFDTIYHEHLCYFSTTALERLFSHHHLTIQEVERIPIHGGSLRIFVTKHWCVGDSVRDLLAEEASLGMDTIEFYQRFAERVQTVKTQLNETLNGLKSKNKSIAAYGAAAKGSTLLNYCGIDSETIDFVVDRSTAKQGRYMPGAHIPILPPEALLARKPDYTVLLAWNFGEEVMRQQADYRSVGGKFIIPIPNVEII